MHLFVDITAHGLGHLAQTAPIIAEIRRHIPTLRLTLRSAISRERLQQRIPEPFTHIATASDFGFVMHNAVDIDYPATAARYRDEHANWTQRIASEAKLLSNLKPDLLIANAAYLPLKAARQVGIPALGMCSLNWADLFQHSFGGDGDWARQLHQEILDAYNAAEVFLRITPGLPMSSLQNRHEIGPIAKIADAKLGRDQRRDHLASLLNIDTRKPWVLIAMGGMDFRLPIETWPELPNTELLCPGAWNINKLGISAIDLPGKTPAFVDLLAAVDVVLTKPGYGTFVEAACNGTAVLYVPRNDWLEEEYLAQWMRANARCATVERHALQMGAIAEQLDALLQQSQVTVPKSVGAEEAFRVIQTILQRG